MSPPNSFLTKNIVISCIIIFSLVACQNGGNNQYSEIEEKLDTLLKEQNIDISQKVNAEDAQQVEGAEELTNITISIMESISKGNVEKAFDIMRKYSPLPEMEFNTARDQTIQQLKLTKPRFGNYIDYEFISSKVIGKSIIRHECIVKCENHILRWEFFYYKPKNKWFLNSFKWDDQIRIIQDV